MATNDEFEQQAQWQQQLCKITKSMNSCRMGDLKLNSTQTIMLHEIQNLPRDKSITNKVKKYGFNSVLCSSNIRNLLHLGLITSTENSKDRRKQDLKLTPKGTKILRQAETQLSKLIKTAQADVKNILER